MADPSLPCPNAKYISGMMIWCSRAGDYCGHAYYMRCKGWWALTQRWPTCPLLAKSKE